MNQLHNELEKGVPFSERVPLPDLLKVINEIWGSTLSLNTLFTLYIILMDGLRRSLSLPQCHHHSGHN